MSTIIKKETALKFIENKAVKKILQEIGQKQIELHFAKIEAAAAINDAELVIKLLSGGSKTFPAKVDRSNLIEMESSQKFTLKFPKKIAQAIYKHFFGEMQPRPKSKVKISAKRYHLWELAPVLEYDPYSAQSTGSHPIRQVTYLSCSQTCEVCGSAVEGEEPPMCCGEMQCTVEKTWSTW